ALTSLVFQHRLHVDTDVSVGMDYFVIGVFFFQAEDGIRDFHVTGVQTCALPIYGVADTGAPGEAVGIVRGGLDLDLLHGEAGHTRAAQQLLHDLARDAALGGQGDVRPFGAADAVDPRFYPHGGDTVHAGLEDVERLGAPEARVLLLAGVLEQPGGDGLPRGRAAHEDDSTLVAGHEGASGGGRPDRDSEESAAQGGIAR